MDMMVVLGSSILAFILGVLIGVALGYNLRASNDE